MPRIARVDVGGEIYHILNRANARVTIFDTDNDYQLFEQILDEGKEKYGMRILAYCVMPNHWHLVLHPIQDGDLQSFMGWVTNTHTRRWHVAKKTVGEGHLYQGRYKSFLCEEDVHFLTLMRYVERNAKKANLVRQAENWKWSSVWRRTSGTPQQQKLLSPWPVPEPRQYLQYLNTPQTQLEEDAIERSISKNIPFGADSWRDAMIEKYELGQTVRGVGRPKNSG